MVACLTMNIDLSTVHLSIFHQILCCFLSLSLSLSPSLFLSFFLSFFQPSLHLIICLLTLYPPSTLFLCVCMCVCVCVCVCVCPGATCEMAVLFALGVGEECVSERVPGYECVCVCVFEMRRGCSPG